MPTEKEQNTRLPPVRPVRGTPEKRQSPRPRGGGGGWGCLLGLAGAETQPAARLPAAPGHFRSPPPAQRQVLALPGAPAGLCAARAAPAGVWLPGGTAAGGAGGGEAGRRGGSGAWGSPGMGYIFETNKATASLSSGFSGKPQNTKGESESIRLDVNIKSLVCLPAQAGSYIP